MAKEFESSEINLDIQKELIKFDKMLPIKSYSHLILLLHRDSEIQLKLALINSKKKINKIYPFFKELFKYKIIDVILDFNDKILILYIKERKTYILITNIDREKYSDILIFQKPIKEAKMEIKNNELIILSNFKLYFFEFINSKKIF